MVSPSPAPYHIWLETQSKRKQTNWFYHALSLPLSTLDNIHTWQDSQEPKLQFPGL